MSGHGHVVPNPDGARARCGGPAICRDCALEYVRVHRPVPEDTGWRVGRKVGRTLYFDGKLVGVMDTPELARLVVDAVNARG